MTRSWRQRIGAAVVFLCLLAAAVKTLDLAVRRAPLPPAARLFIHHYEGLAVRPPADLWERLTLSWLLSHAGVARPGPGAPGSG